MKIGEKINVKINGDLKSAEVVSILAKNDEKFVIYSVYNESEDANSLYASKILETPNGITLIDVQDEYLLDYILKLISKEVRNVTGFNKEPINNRPQELKPNDIPTKKTLENGRVTEETIEDTINIMKEWSELNN